ncbi:hypothetical protein BAUCODRAFT_149983 [Baudoinia panamericana UAMH 10762]|uniref:1-acyl-sn-glycerol-3-phosphate acyltransferase n=1 Tax=Baudoinia panamericana (strain UAMH 10762) TaxID=717646 RepID=M2N4Q7_BAUPA|nr:uncharacterized protein BAUCODRAFT_149983 [Baudoinia panamericana UAMH 10762]EMC93725.1 hypothetical protein BAUCODRAFT_149983 [Baudoinia panamericana UAMH 10762]
MNLVLFWLLTPAAAIFLTVQTLLILGQVLRRHDLEFFGRTIAFFIALLICATYGTIASACLNVAGYGGLGQWATAQSFKWTMLLFTNVAFEIDDPRNYLNKTRPAVFVGNHQTELDILFLAHIWPKYCSVTAKKSLKYIPFLGWFMSLSRTVFIERTSREQAVAAFAKAAQQMHEHKQSVYIFPEGTRSYYDHPDMLPFKKGAFHLAVQAQVPIVPVVSANYSAVLNFKKRIFRQGRISVKVLEPVPTKGKTKEDVDALLEEVREKMLAELKKLTSHAREEGVALKEHEASHAKANGTAKASGVDMVHNAAA